MRIAILGATSQIAKDLIVSYSAATDTHLHLFARRPDVVTKWLASVGLAGRFPADDFAGFGKQQFDALINFVGSGNPAQTAAMGASIMDVTYQYDQLALEYARQHPACRYLFLSSGAAYGSSFEEPANEHTKAVIPINDLKPQDWYAVAKLYSECRHRSLAHLPIIDIRIFNYFSRTLDISSRFLITDILRDFLHPSDLYRMVNALLTAPAANTVVDCYTLGPIDKPSLLAAMQEKFGLRYEITEASASVNATGGKPYYYSLNTRASAFGYEPRNTSLDGILREATELLGITSSVAVAEE
jgi:nucleoside-diphosphate-sugar epimerase